ncbi:metallophosphoesterase [Aeropyrum camini]|uniref:Phosphoesterase n=1 Tax=Aeropyrum camini SY1 = JCM 12091 TaxID=1198449 RepID=U3TD70_9CREN|nr:metallophosphoesterase [Aeropyrum camini]BAN89975.1 predicted phosphoesterase [Aeropyrum camini SY1 = JCM 12091]
MLVGVLSDTHDNLALARRAGEVFIGEGVEAVIHLGDYVAPFTLAELLGVVGGRARFYGVFGNNDGERLGLARIAEGFGATLLDPPATVTLGGRRLLLLHGFGSPENTVEIVDALAASGRWDAVLYGHTHKARIERVGGSLVLNPGDGGGSLEKPSAALLDLEAMEARLVSLEG